MAVGDVCRTGDPVSGTCTQHVPARAWTGVWGAGSTILKADGIGVIRVNDTGVCSCGHTFKANAGSTIIKDGILGLHRVGDAVIVIGGGTGNSLSGSLTVKAL